MKSFPTSLMRGGKSLNNSMISTGLKNKLINTAKSAVLDSLINTMGTQGLDTSGIDYDLLPDTRNLLDSFNFGNDNENYVVGNALFVDNENKKDNYIENVYRFGGDIFNEMNNYRGYLENVDIFEHTVYDKESNKVMVEGINFNRVVPSLFNPMYGLIGSSITSNVPLVDGGNYNGFNDLEYMKTLSNCSIKALVEESNQSNGGVLGYAKYKYADFMYCKHLGEVSNNHLITLRKYTLPIGDDITNNLDDHSQLDIARLVTWFGTEDNKLENILSYDYEATWKPLESFIDEQQSQEEDAERGKIGQLANLASPSYLNDVARGVATGGFLGNLLGKFGGKPAYSSNPVARGERYDKNKVYEPKDTIRSTHIYEGNLKFNHEFTLKFSYKLRAYDNINPKSAFLDLIGNILAMTYRDGTFWGGTRKILGPTTNQGVWNKATNTINGIENKVISAFNSILSGGFDINSMLSNLSGMVESMMNSAKELVGNIDGEKIKNKVKSSGEPLLRALGGLVKNKLGRPAMYAFSTLLDAGNVGLWHVTIGNPKNPIASFGNLILTKAKITHNGPLGIDDFPTELIVEVSLKHARPRSSSEIQRMYTKGMRAIYYGYGVRKDDTTEKSMEEVKANNTSKEFSDNKQEQSKSSSISSLIDNEKLKIMRDQVM